MHPILSEKKRLFMYLFVWSVLGTLSGVVLSSVNGLEVLHSAAFTLPMMLIFGEVNLSAWFLCRAFPLERNSPWKILTMTVVSVIIVSLAWTALGWVWMKVVEQAFDVSLSPIPLGKSMLIIFGIGAQLFLISIALSYLIAAFERSKIADRDVFESKLQAQTAELKALRMQINPHFLFNSLNSISALIMSDSTQARAMTITLADFFRKSLLYGAKEAISLQEELSILNHYLDIEKVRFGSRLNVREQIAQNTLSDRVPPLLLQPLVENAIKHGISGTIDGGTVSISTQKKQNRLFITVENPVDLDTPAMKGTGMGLDIVKKRLTALYGNNADIKSKRNGDVFQVVIFLPAQSE